MIPMTISVSKRGPSSRISMLWFWRNQSGQSLCQKAVFLVSREDEQLLRGKFIEHKIAALVEEDQVPRDRRGRKVLAGLFTVPHKAVSDRVIFDRRPQNSQEEGLKWTTLPHGSLLCQLRLAPGHSVRGSGDDRPL